MQKLWEGILNENDKIYIDALNKEITISEKINYENAVIGIHENDIEINKNGENTVSAVLADIRKGMFQNTYIFKCQNTNIYAVPYNEICLAKGDKVKINLPEEKIFVIKKQE